MFGKPEVTVTRARRSGFVCQLASPTHELAASGNSSEVGAQPNSIVGVSIDISDATTAC
jgi:hypothetical protein